MDDLEQSDFFCCVFGVFFLCVCVGCLMVILVAGNVQSTRDHPCSSCAGYLDGEENVFFVLTAQKNKQQKKKQVAWRGTTLATGSLDQTVKLWRPGVAAVTLRAHTLGVTSVDVSSEGLVASAGLVRRRGVR